MARVSAPTLIGAKKKDETDETAPPAAPATPPRRRRTSRKKSPETADTGAAGASPDQPTSEAAPVAEKDAQPAGKGLPARPSEPPQPDGIPGEKRITLPLWEQMWRSLSLARVDDGIDTTVRIRTMIELWEFDPRFRARVDKLARKRAGSLSRGRPRTH